MKNKNKQLPQVSHQYQSRAGYLFNSHDSYWKLDKNIGIYVKPIHGLLDGNTKNGFINTLIFYSINFSSSHVNSIYYRFLHFLRTTGDTQVSEAALINYRASLTRNTEWYLATIRGFLRKWHELGYPGVSEDVIDLLAGWRIKGNNKGDDIKGLNPMKGPLTDIELLAFNEGAISAFENDDISVTKLAIGLSISHTGRRAIQISHLKIKDVLEGKNKEGEKIYLLNIPRAKQRGVVFRQEFRQFAITKELWVILNAQVKEVKTQIGKRLCFSLQKKDFLELPLFPDFKVFKEIESPQNLRNLQYIDKPHIRSGYVTEVLKKIVKVANVHSERTGELLYITSKRFRSTIGTRAAREGFGELVIAELLDHTDTQNAGVYVQNIPEHVEALDQAIGQQLAPYAQAFAGVLIDSEKDAKRGEDLNSRIKANGENIGSCGSYGFCGANVPIPCYTCMNFQPWLDGPHQRVMDELVSERQRVFEMTKDKQIAAVNDRSILAVQNVIDRCDARREELKNG